jgi:hypothetical protein
MNNFIILVLAIALTGLTIFAQVERVIAQESVTKHTVSNAESVKNGRYCEQMLDGIWVRDDAEQKHYCRLDSGYITIGE